MTNPKITIERLDLGDTTAVHQAADVWMACFGPGTTYKGTWTHDRAINEVLHETPHKADGNIFVAKLEGRVVAISGGYAFHEFMRQWGDENLPAEHKEKFKPYGKTYYADFLATHPDFEGKGIGRQLSDARDAFAREHGYQSIAFRTVHPRLIALAEHKGSELLFEHASPGRSNASSTLTRKYYARRL